MRVSVFDPGAMAPDLAGAWRRLQENDPAFASPFLRPEFAQAVAAVRRDVRVAVADEGGAPVAFLPFQQRGGVGLPAGGGLSDCQAIVASPDWSGDLPGLLRAACLARFDVTNLLASQAQSGVWRRATMDSPVIALAGGFDAYAQERRGAGSNAVTQGLSHARRLERQLGPLRFVLHDPDPRTLHRLIAWKRAQYARPRWGGALDPFARPWTVELLERIHATREDGFAGMLSALWAGDALVAAHMGMRSRRVLHYWFPAHDEAHARLAPGRILLLEMIRGAAAAGIERIELGAGEEGYKRRFANAAVELVAGSAAASAPALWRRRAWHAAGSLARHLPLPGRGHAEEWVFRREWEWLHA